MKSGDRIKELTSDTSAIVDLAGTDQDALVESIIPFSVEGPSGVRELIDSTLKREGDGYAARRAAVTSSIPDVISNGIEVGREVRFEPVGAGEAERAQVIDDKAFYANVERDTDLLVAALPTGVETFTQLRSPKSPEKHTFRFSLANGASLERTGGGGVTIERDGDRVATISPVAASDAQGQPVPVTYSIHGRDLTMNVDHRGRDLAYPIVVDPVVSGEPGRSHYADGMEFTGWWEFKTNRPGLILKSVDGSFGWGPYVVMPRSSEQYRDLDYGQWSVKAPGTIFIFRTDWIKFRLRGDSQYRGGVPCMTVGFQAPDYGWLGDPQLVDCGVPRDISHKEICGGNPPCWPNSMPAGNRAAFMSWTYGGGTRVTEDYAWVDDAHVYEHDLDRPWFKSVTHSAQPTGWVDTVSESVTATAEDTGFGIKTISMSVPDANEASGKRADPRSHSCVGSFLSRCPATWSNNSSYRSWAQTFDYSTASPFPEGEQTMGLYAVDAIGNPTTGAAGAPTHDSHQWVVKVDRTPPASPDPSGPMTKKYVGENPTLGTVATDTHSGVKTTQLQVAGSPVFSQVKESASPPCSAAAGCPKTHDTRNDPFTWNTTGFAEGPHQYTVTATDPLGHAKTTDPKTVRLDRTDPTLTLSGELYARRFQPRQPPDVPQSLPPGSYNLHLDGKDGLGAPPPNNKDGSGMKWFRVSVAGQKRDGDFFDYAPPTVFGPYACNDGNCDKPDDWTFTTSQYTSDTGLFRIKVEAIDQVENQSQQEFTVKVEQPDVSTADMLGLEDWWQYDSTPTGAGSAVHVNVANGNLVWHSVPVVNPGRGLSTVVNLTYNSHLRQPAPLLETPLEQGYAPYDEAGAGFSLGVSSLTRLNERLNVDLAAAGRITLTDPDGTQHLFRASPGSDVFAPPPGVNIHLRRFSKVEGLGTPDPTGYVPLEQPDRAWAATRPDGVTHFFDQRGYQTSVVDRNGNAITFNYRYRGPTHVICQRAADTPTFAPPEVLCPRKLDTAVDAGGRAMSFTYEPRLIASLPPALKPSDGSVPEGCQITPTEAEPPPEGQPPVDPQPIETQTCASGRLSTITDHAGRVTRFRYTSEGYLSNLTLAAGGEKPRVFHLTYRKQSELEAIAPLVAVTDPRGSLTKFEYHAADATPPAYLRFSRKLKAVVDRNEEPEPESSPDPDGNTVEPEKKTTFAYATNPYVTTVTDTRGFAMAYDMEASGSGSPGMPPAERGRLNELTDARGHRTRLEWDNEVAGQMTDDNNVARITRHAAGGTEAAATTMTYNQNGMLRTSSDPLGRVTTLTYADSGGPVALRSQRPGSIDASGTFVSDLTSLARPKAGTDTQFEYDDNTGSRLGNVTKRIDGEGNPATTTYDSFGQITKERDEAGNETEYQSYDPNGLPQTLIDPRDKTWTYSYDAVGNLRTAKDPRATGEACGERQKFRREFEYNEFDQLSREYAPKNGCEFITRTFGYDDNGNRTAAVDGNGNGSSITYTRMDDVDKRMSPALSHASEGGPASEDPRYEPDGDPVYTDGRSTETTNLDYDTEENLIRVRSPKGELTADRDDFATEFRYNGVGERVASIRHQSGGSPAKLATGFAYDGRGNVIGVSDPANNAANPTAEPEANAIDPRKRRFTYEYDLADNRTDAIEDPRMPDDPPGQQGLDLRTEYTYDANDNLERVTDPRGVATQTAQDFETKYCYDDRDLLTDVIDGESNHTRYVLRADGKLSAEISPRGMPRDRDCDVSPKAASNVAGGDFRTEYDYFETGELKSRSVPKAPDQYAPVGRTVTYDRNDVGDPTTITDARNDPITNTFYDTGELASTTRPSWWTFDPGASAAAADDPLGSRLEGPAAAAPGSHDTGEVRERTPEEMLADDGTAPELPRSEGFGDYGEVEPQEPPDLMPRTTSGTGGKTTFDYDGEMRLKQIAAVVTGGGSSTVSIERDPLGRVTKTTQPLTAGRDIVNAYGYDHNGNLRTHQISNQNGDADPDRVQTTFDYDQFDRKIKESSPGTSLADLEKIEFGYDANDNLTQRKIVGGARLVAAYDALDRLKSVTNPMGDDTNDQDTEELGDGDDETTRHAYDDVGNLLTETSPEGRVTTRTYDQANRVKSVDGPLVDPTTFEYDEAGNQTKVTAPGAGNDDIVTERTFDGRDLKWSETVGTTTKRTIVTEYDPNGNLRRTVNPAGVSATENENGTPEPDNAWDGEAPTKTSTAAENATVREYSLDNQLTSIHLPYGDPDGDAPNDARRWRQDFDRNRRGRVEAHKAPYDWSDDCPTPPVNNDPGCPSTTTYTYFDTDWIRSMSDPRIADPDGTEHYSHAVDYDYDVRGNQTSWKSPKHQTDRRIVTRTFFPSGMLKERKSQESGGGTRTYQHQYDRNHQMTRMTDVQKGRVTKVAYDMAERPILVDEDWGAGRDTAVFYDKDGLTTTRRTDGEVSTELDRSTYSGGKTTSFRYDGAGREDRMWVCTSSPAATCPASGATRTTETAYYSGSNLIHTRRKPNDVVETFHFLDDAKLQRMQRDKGANDLKDQPYEYDDNGNRTRDERGRHLFNVRNQLIRWTKGSNTADPNETVCYELNGAGAQTKRTESDDTTCGVGDTITEFDYKGDRLHEAHASAPGHQDSTERYTYDDFGSVEKIQRISPDQGPATTFDYDEFGRMIKSRGPADNADRNYTFDGLDRRDTRTVGSDAYDFAYVGMTERLSREEAPDGSGRKVHSYDYDSGMRRQGKRTKAGAVEGPYRSYAKDANGSVEGLEDGEGEFLGTPDGQPNYRYDPYGELEDDEDVPGDAEEEVGGAEAEENPFRFEGFYYDSGIKTYDMQARPYRPEVGRFLTQDRYESASGDLNLEADPITQNRYAFAGGNPVNRIEWDGHCGYVTGVYGGLCNNPFPSGGGGGGGGGKGKGKGGGGGGRGRGGGAGGAFPGHVDGNYHVFTGVRPVSAPPPPPRMATPSRPVCPTPPTKGCARGLRFAPGGAGGDGVSGHTVADAFGFLAWPVDAGHAAWYTFVEGKPKEGILTGLAAIPGAGDAFQGARKGPKIIDDLAAAPKATDDVAKRLPPYTGGKASGILDTGSKRVDLVSGYGGPSSKLPRRGNPGMNNRIRAHVEAHAAAVMRLEGINEATLYINRIPCSGATGCNAMLPRMLPRGARLHVRGPNGWRRTYTGLPD